MKIAIVTMWYAEHSILLANGFSNMCDVCLYTAKNSVFESWKHKIKDNVNVNVFDKPSGTIKNKKKGYEVLCKKINKEHPDFVIVQDGNLILSRCIQLIKCPKIVTIHDPVPHIGEKHIGHKLINNFAMSRSCDEVIVHCQLDAMKIRRYYFIKREKILVSSLGIHDLYLTEHQYDEKKQALFFGRIQKYKGLKYFIEAQKYVEKIYPEFKFVIAGRGDDLGKYKKYIKDQTKFVVLDRYIENNEVDKLFAESQIVVLPYISATQSGVLLTAFAYGKPVVGADVGGIGEILKKLPLCGELVRKKNSKQLAKAMIKILKNKCNYCYDQQYIGEFTYRNISERLVEHFTNKYING